jgi:hypothetical protein
MAARRALESVQVVVRLLSWFDSDQAVGHFAPRTWGQWFVFIFRFIRHFVVNPTSGADDLDGGEATGCLRARHVCRHVPSVTGDERPSRCSSHPWRRSRGQEQEKRPAVGVAGLDEDATDHSKRLLRAPHPSDNVDAAGGFRDWLLKVFDGPSGPRAGAPAGPAIFSFSLRF